jgi:hypothetical protein
MTATHSTPSARARTRVSALTPRPQGSAEPRPSRLGFAPTPAYALPQPDDEEVNTLSQARDATLTDELYPLHHYIRLDYRESEKFMTPPLTKRSPYQLEAQA